MKKRIDFSSQDGAASVLEATIVYPIVLAAVIFLIMVGFTYLQKGFLQHEADEFSAYIAKAVRFPGYEKIVPVPGTVNGTIVITREKIDSAMAESDPYRYIAGIFGNTEKELSKQIAQAAVDSKGFLKPASGSAPEAPSFSRDDSVYENGGRVCVVHANGSEATVYIGQRYIFSDMFRMIGIGGKATVISAQCTTSVCDNVEVMRITDAAFDAVNFILGKLGVSKETMDKAKSYLDKITGAN